jgi:F0F1-type ATP synthase delta subunit
MKQEYTKALLATLETEISVSSAISGLRTAMEKKHHLKLFGPVLLEVLRVLESKSSDKSVKISVAHASDIKKLKSEIADAIKTLGVPKDARTRETIDDTLIGGFVATYDHKEYDASYKKSLKSLYESIVK